MIVGTYIAGTGTLTNNGLFEGAGTFSGTHFVNGASGTIGYRTTVDNLTFSNGFTNNGLMEFELSSGSFDKTTVVGTANLGGTFNALGSVSIGNMFIVVTATSINGTFTNYSVNLGGGKYANMYYTSTTAKIVIESTPLSACTTPTAYTVTGTGSYCSTGTGTSLGLSGSENGVTYQLKNGATVVGGGVSGTGSAISFPSQTTAATYTVVATRTTGSCTAAMTGSAVVTIAPNVATPSFTAPTTSLCAGATATYTATAANSSSIIYTLLAGGASINNTTGGVSSVTGNFTVVATASGTCGATTSTSQAVTVTQNVATPSFTTRQVLEQLTKSAYLRFTIDIYKKINCRGTAQG